MDRAFKFPPPTTPPEPPVSPIPNIHINGEPAPRTPSPPPSAASNTHISEEALARADLPPPTPAKAKPMVEDDADVDEEVGETVEVDLS